jgi:choline/carnitine/betaine transport
MNHYLKKWSDLVTAQFDWFVMISVNAFLVIAVFLCVSPFGKIRLGQEGEKPEYSNLSWFSMLFAAGMGTGLVFHGAAEPLFHSVSPPPPSAEITKQNVMMITFLHWGIHAWTIYAIAGLTIAYFTFTRGEKMLASAPITSHFSLCRAHPVAGSINIIAIIATLFGLIASITTGIYQMQGGALQLGWFEEKAPWQLYLILGILTLFYLASSSSGIKKGIRSLSNLNMLLCLTLLAFVFFVGPSKQLAIEFAENIRRYFSHFFTLSFDMRQNSPESREWLQQWTVNYFLWWIAWAPFVAIFIARISRGRTIRQFLGGVILAPTLFCCLWFTVMGGTAFHLDASTDSTLASIAQADMSQAMFALLAELPYSIISQSISLFLIFIFLVTSADSGAYILAIYTDRGNLRPPLSQRLFWSMVIAAFSAAILSTNEGIFFLKNISLTGALPYMLIMLLQCYILWKALRGKS